MKAEANKILIQDHFLYKYEIIEIVFLLSSVVDKANFNNFLHIFKLKIKYKFLHIQKFSENRIESG